MTERIAIPAWNTESTPIATWVEALETRLGPVVMERDGPDGAWLEVDSRLVRGYAMLEGPHIVAVNFEIEAKDPDFAIRDIESACEAIGWELHIDDDPDADQDDDDN